MTRWSEDQLAEHLARAGRGTAPRPAPVRAVAGPRRDLEHEEQVALFQWAALHVERWPDLAWLYAVPNAGAGGQRGQAGKMKAEGVRAGVPDIMLDVPRGGYFGFALELKRTGGGRLSPEQRRWLEHQRTTCNRRAVVAAGFDEARACLENYLNQPLTQTVVSS